MQRFDSHNNDNYDGNNHYDNYNYNSNNDNNDNNNNNTSSQLNTKNENNDINNNKNKYIKHPNQCNPNIYRIDYSNIQKRQSGSNYNTNNCNSIKNRRSSSAENKNMSEKSFYSPDKYLEFKKDKKLLNSYYSGFLNGVSLSESKNLFSVFHYHSNQTVKYNEKQFQHEMSKDRKKHNVTNYFRFSSSTVVKEFFCEQKMKFVRKKVRESLNLKIISKVSPNSVKIF